VCASPSSKLASLAWWNASAEQLATAGLDATTIQTLLRTRIELVPSELLERLAEAGVTAIPALIRAIQSDCAKSPMCHQSSA
jgi:hypothetical protein